MPNPNEQIVTAAGFQGPAAPSQSAAAGLQYQHFTTDVNAHGFLGGTLGRGPRSVPSANSFFSAPPTSGRNLSAGQFGAGSAKDPLADPEEENE
jgi:hypothetical protein